jgi:hypothetical protein
MELLKRPPLFIVWCYEIRKTHKSEGNCSEYNENGHEIFLFQQISVMSSSLIKDMDICVCL